MTGASLKSRHCKPCKKGSPPLSDEQSRELLGSLHEDWTPDEKAKSITRTFAFGNYYETIAFVNAVAWIANSEDHHPDLEVGYNRCKVTFSTHSIGGLSDNDFICAARLDDLLPPTT